MFDVKQVIALLCSLELCAEKQRTDSHIWDSKAGSSLSRECLQELHLGKEKKGRRSQREPRQAGLPVGPAELSGLA